jgi:LmbE family N-acetylglucosaminyl deacetylase
MMRLMTVMAHPDDAEIWCGGTLILHAEKGDKVRICIISYTAESTRGKEAIQAANQMGCEVEFFGLEDTAIRDTEDVADKLRLSIDAFCPDTIITHWYDDMHPDHEAAFRILRRSLIRGFLIQSKKNIDELPQIFCCDTYNSLGLHGPFKPDNFVDVTPIWDKKIAAINVHAGQPLKLFLDMIEKQCSNHGRAAGTKWAEGFLHLPLFGRPNVGTPLGG